MELDVGMSSGRLTHSPRATLHVKTSQADHGDERPMPMAHGHGRRLIQMIFRSNNEEDSTSARPPREAHMVVTSPIAIPVDARSEDEVPVGSTRLSALKRKLFPSRKRRHPVRIPPLIVSPITTSPPSVELDGNNNDEVYSLRTKEESVDDENSSAFEPATTGDYDVGEEDCDFDDDLVDAIEAADRLQSATSDETLAEMTRAIDGLHQWKQEHELATATALKAMEEKLKRELLATKEEPEDNTDELAFAGEAVRKQRMAETARNRLAKTLKETEETLASEHSPSEQISRVLFEAERQSANDEVDHVNTAEALLSKLRGDVFDLGVKELSSSIHASLLKELSDADSELEMKFADAEAFASDLDHVLAQFDAAAKFEEPQNPAGQAAQEH